MKTSFDSIACAAIRQPSSIRCGTRDITSRSLNAPGSDSSALTTRYFGLGLLRSTSDALRPIGKPAPPRPRRFEACSSAISSSDVIPAAFAADEYPPIARYSESLVRSRSSVPARRTLSAGTELPHDRGDVPGLHAVAVAVVDDHDRCVPAPAGALDRAERDLAVLGRLARVHAELLLERLDDALRADERAREVRAHLDEVLADRSQVVHVVEGRDRVAVPGREVERVRDLADRVGREPAALLLREPQRRQHRRARALGIARAHLLHPIVEGGAHRSTSPMTESSEPTM